MELENLNQTLDLKKIKNRNIRLKLCSLIKPFPHNDTFSRLWETSLLKTPWEKEKLLVGEIARNKQFLLLPVFSTCLDNFLPFLSNLKLLSANSFNLEESKISLTEQENQISIFRSKN